MIWTPQPRVGAVNQNHHTDLKGVSLIIFPEKAPEVWSATMEALLVSPIPFVITIAPTLDIIILSLIWTQLFLVSSAPI